MRCSFSLGIRQALARAFASVPDMRGQLGERHTEGVVVVQDKPGDHGQQVRGAPALGQSCPEILCYSWMTSCCSPGDGLALCCRRAPAALHASGGVFFGAATLSVLFFTCLLRLLLLPFVFLQLGSSKFCGVLPGDGFTSTMEEAMMHGCIPVIIQVHTTCAEKGPV